MANKLETMTVDGLRAEIQHEVKTGESPFLLEELLEAFLAKAHTDHSWPGLPKVGNEVISTVLFDNPDLTVEEDSNIDMVSHALVIAGYRKALSDCAAMLGVTDVRSFSFMVDQFTESTEGKDAQPKPMPCQQVIDAVQAYRKKSGLE